MFARNKQCQGGAGRRKQCPAVAVGKATNREQSITTRPRWCERIQAACKEREMEEVRREGGSSESRRTRSTIEAGGEEDAAQVDFGGGVVMGAEEAGPRRGSTPKKKKNRNHPEKEGL